MSEEIESRLERSFDRTESLGGVEYEALFQMMAAAARVIEGRLGKSPFSDPEASSVARNTWRQIIYNLTSNPLADEAVKEQLGIIHELANLKLPARPSPKVQGGIGDAVSQQMIRERQEQLLQYEREWTQWEQQIREYQRKLEEFSQKPNDLNNLANEAAARGLLFPKHQ